MVYVVRVRRFVILPVFGPGGEPINNPSRNPPHPSVLVGGVGGATARSALGWYRPSVGVPRDVGC